MTKSKSNFWLTGALCFGSIVGAGFASGKEIEFYFAQFGISIFPIIILVGVLFCIILKFFLNFGYKNRIVSFSQMNKLIWGKYEKIGNIFFIISNLLLLSAMLSGSDAIGNLIIKQDYRFFSVITAILAIVISLLKFKKLVKINAIVVPLLLILIIFDLCFSLNIGKIPTNSPKISVVFSPIFALFYLTSNLYLASFVFAKIGNSTLLENHTKASIVCATLFTIFACLITLIIFSNSSEVSPMPLISILGNISPKFMWFGALVVWLGIFSTIVNILFTLSNEFKNKSYKTFFLILISALGLILSGLGFSFIVNYFYPLIGIMGLITICKMMKK